MTYTISDFLPWYPDIQGGDFNNHIKSKQEFREPPVKNTESFPSKKGELFAHQVLVSRLLSSHTPYDGILLMHEMGTGKTCSAAAIIQQVRSENNGIDNFIYVAKNSSLLDNFDDEFRGKCTVGDYSSVKKLGQIGIQKLTYDGFAKEYKTKSPSNSVIIIDEIHNIRGKSQSFTESSTYNDFHKILKKVVNAKVILLSGTPITDKPSEIASIMNLILPVDMQLPLGKEFDKDFIDSGNGVIKNRKGLIMAFKGRVSYIKAMESSVKKVFIGKKEDGFNHFKLHSSQMSEEQTNGYLKALKQDTEGGSPAFSNSLQAADIVVGEDFGVSLKPVSLKGTTTTEKLKDLEKYSSKYAASIRTIIKARSERKSVFVFNKHVEGGGLKTFASILKQFGFSEVTKDEIKLIDKPAPRFVMLTGNAGVDTTTLGRIGGKSTKGWGGDLGVAVKRFNNVDNVNGRMIGVVLASEAISEGYSFNNVQVIDIHSPWFNFAKISQVIARGIRVGSHQGIVNQRKLSGDERNIDVDIHLRISKPMITENPLSIKYPRGIDVYAYKTAEEKDIIVKKIEHIIKEHSIDSYLNRKRNWRDPSLDGTRDCDYTTCKYTSFPDTRITKGHASGIDHSTFELYYPDNENDKKIIETIIEMFNNRYSLRLSDIIKLYDIRLNRPIVRALITIVTNDIPIKTSRGDICFLREQNNIYYLVNTYSNTTTILDMYYAENKYSDIPYLDVGSADSKNIDYTKVTDIQTLNFEMRGMTNEEKEVVLETNIPNGNPFVLEKFKGLWGKIDGNTYSWFLLSKKGDGRMLQPESGWVNTTKETTRIIKDHIDDIKKMYAEKAKRLFGEGKQPYYGLFEYSDNYTDTTPLIFSIIKVIDTSGIVDKRKMPSGLKCESFTGPENTAEIKTIMTVLSTMENVPRLYKDDDVKLTTRCRWIENAMKSVGLLTRDIRV
jgi:hypothetical protein